MTRYFMRWRRVILIVVVVTAVAAGLGYFLFPRAFSDGFSAREEPSAIEAFVARRVRRLSLPRAAREARNPVAASPEVLNGAMEHFADHCAICHGNDGRGKTLIGKGLYPKPPDMTEAGTQQLTDGELYYVIQNGIRLTGMPAFGEEGANEPDNESWALVYFIRHLPVMTDEEVAEIKAMNPKSPSELAREERMRKFLEGDDSSPPESGHEHHH
jgi:mono/diheme cytochrome c family protein